MSMTLVAFLKKAEIPNKTKIQERIRQLDYDFEILDDFDSFYGLDGLECKINGHSTFFEIYNNEPSEITNECDWIKSDLTDQDTTISFIWGADFAAGACIGLISIALIDYSNALIYYLDDEMKYSREMLVADTPMFLNELEKQNNNIPKNQATSKTQITDPEKKKSFWDRLKHIFEYKKTLPNIV